MKASTRGGAPARGTNGARIDLGREPPLTVGDTREGVPQRRSVSIRWLTGTVLTGFTSTILMGGALMAALDGRHQLAFPPEAGRTLRASEAGGDVPLTNGAKGDRMRTAREPATDRQIVQVSTVTKQGDRDLIKLKPFARIATPIATAITALSDGVPAYDPVKIVAGAAGARDKGSDKNDTPPPAATEKLGVIDDEGASGDGGDDGIIIDGAASDAADDTSGTGADVVAVGAEQEQIYGANVEGEVSIKVSDFPVNEAPQAEEPSFSPEEAEQVARASTQTTVSNGVQIAAMPYVDPDRFSFDESGTDPFSALGVRIVPENVSFVSKSGPAIPSDERVAVVEKKETLGDILAENGVAEDESKNIVSAMSNLMDLSDLQAGQKVRILFSSEGESPKPMRVSIYDEGSHQATVARRDDDTFVRADEPESSTDEFEMAEPAPADDGPMPRLYQAVYETALEQKIPGPLITELIHIFSYDVDFQSRVSPGDSLEVFHSLPDAGSDDEEILYAAITLDGATKRYYRSRSPDDGVVDYFDEEGRSAKKFLVRKPMNGGVLRSNFGYRKHPILGYTRLHPGVDWAAPRGTPILAAGNGVVEKAGWSSGYGNFTLIRHTNGYESAYGHQSAIAKGIRPGAKVRQGQVIGYLGSTGLSTGPHLHYEVRINNKPVDPLRVRLPRGRVLQGDMLVAFKQEKARIDTLIGMPASSKVAAINTDEDATN